MSADLGNAPEPVGWVGNRNFIVPPDIIPVRRISPLPKKKRTPCCPRPEGEPICRAGDREWFGADVFADSDTRDLRTVCATSMTAHTSCFIGVLVLLAGQAAPATPVPAGSPLRMPAFVALSGDGGGISARHLPIAAQEHVAAVPNRAVAKAAPPKRSATPNNATPVAKPMPDETAVEEDAPVQRDDASTRDANTEPDAETQAGTPDGMRYGIGVSGDPASGGGHGVGQGSGDAAGAGHASAAPAIAPGPYRWGPGIEPPRKIKHVAPIYPAAALASRALGTVVIEVVVGTDGRVHDARVIHSIPLLDGAALDAVRQWEFEPSRLNGSPVAVIVTVLVQFAMY